MTNKEWRRMLQKILKKAPRNTGQWTGDNETLGACGGIPMALNLLTETEAEYYHSASNRTLPGLSGFIVRMEGGAAIAIMAHEDQDVTLDVPNQTLANAVLFNLLGNKFLLPSIPRKWGDVVEITWFHMKNTSPVAFLFHYDTLWPTQPSQTTTLH